MEHNLMYYQSIVFFTILYASARVLLYKVNRPHEAANYIVSMINTYLFLATGNIQLFISYYLYDLVLMIMYKEYAFILHHIVTLYLTTLSESDPYYNIMILITYSMKISDLTFYWFKIITAAGFSLPRIYKFSLGSSIILWLVFRVIFPIYIHSQLFGTNIILDTFAMGLYVANLIWVYQMYYIYDKKYNTDNKTIKLVRLVRYKKENW